MVYIGLFVLVEFVDILILDRIFIRVGVSDDLF